MNKCLILNICSIIRIDKYLIFILNISEICESCTYKITDIINTIYRYTDTANYQIKNYIYS